jgi:hypothetical protein
MRMVRQFLAATMLASILTACQGSGSVPGTGGSTQPLEIKHITNPNDYSNCGVRGLSGIKPKGGHFIISSIPSSENFGGAFQYGPLSAKYREGSAFFSCADDENNTPVPPGYTADWFGTWTLCDVECAFSFESGRKDRRMYLYSTTWQPKTTYYLYVYATAGQSLIESYSIGTVHVKGRLNHWLKFASPFANGLTWPTNDTITLEIVHAS